MNRRSLLTNVAKAAAGIALLPRSLEAAPKLRVTTLELLPMRATARTVWLFVRLGTDAGLTGLGEASDAFGFANTSTQNAAQMEKELRAFFGLIQGKSPLEIAAYRRDGEQLATGRGLIPATAYSAIEQALWDLSGKALDVPTYSLFGGKLRDTLPVYANVNRATRLRTPEGFATAARAAVKDGFRAVKAALWDGFPPLSSTPAVIEAAAENGIACVVAMREAIGFDVELMVRLPQLLRRAARRARRAQARAAEARVVRRASRSRAHGRDVRDSQAHSAADGRWRNPVRHVRVRAAVPNACRARDHAGRQTLRRPARADTHCGHGGSGGRRSGAAQSQRPGVHGRQRAGVRGVEKFPVARAAMGRGRLETG